MHDCVTTSSPGIKKVYVNLDDEVVIVETCLPSSDVQRQLEATGKLVVFRGHGGMGTCRKPDHSYSAGCVPSIHGAGGNGLTHDVLHGPLTHQIRFAL